MPGNCWFTFIFKFPTIVFLSRLNVQSGASGEGLGWVDLDLGSSPGWGADTVATYCPSRMVEHPKSKSTQPSPSPEAPDCTSISSGSHEGP